MFRTFRPQLRTYVGLAALAIAAAVAVGRAADDTAVSGARMDLTEPGRLVVSAETTGQLPGLLTLDLRLAPDGAVVSGEWALVVRYVEDLDGGTPAAEGESSEPHQEHIRLVDRGTLSGSIAGAQLVTDASGTVTGVSAQVQLNAGSLSFASVAAGSGRVSIDATATGRQGDLTLQF